MSQINKLNILFITNKFSNKVLYLAICLITNSLYSQNLSFNKFSVGTHYQNTVESTYWFKDKYTIKGLAAEFGFCSSILGTTIKQKNKFIFGEHLGGELRVGYSSPTNFKIWNGYLFDIGGSVLWNMSENQQVKLNVIFLKFGSDLLLPNISGSGIAAEYRFRKMTITSNITANNDRFTGWVKGFSSKPMKKHVIGFRSGIEFYIKNNHWIGLEYAMFPINQKVFAHDFKTIYSSYSFKLFLCKRF